MSGPRVEIDLGKIEANARRLVERLGAGGVSVTGVTKGVCGHPGVARALLDGGVVGLADARLSNILRMRKAGIVGPISMIRAPMIDEMETVIQCCDASYHTEINTVLALAAAARERGTRHEIILMVEMGDMRDGIPPEDLEEFAVRVVATPGVSLRGISANFACLGGVAPTVGDMAKLSRLADRVEGASGPFVDLVSGGGSANLSWALGGGATGRINDLRLGEAILLGTDPMTGSPIDGLHTDAFALFAEVIEARMKPALVTTRPLVASVGSGKPAANARSRTRLVLGVGQQDTDPSGLTLPAEFGFIGATSDHTVIDATEPTATLGFEVKMGMNYSALMRAMAAPDVDKIARGRQPLNVMTKKRQSRPFLCLI